MKKVTVMKDGRQIEAESFDFGKWDGLEGGRVRLSACTERGEGGRAVLSIDVLRFHDPNTAVIPAIQVGSASSFDNRKGYLLLQGALSAHHGSYGELWVDGRLEGCAYRPG